jgi:hypothetical protein
MRNTTIPTENKDLCINKVICPDKPNKDEKMFFFRQKTSVEAMIIATQYFSIEDLIIESFKFVTPIRENSKTCSAKFATIIRESCNLYELICKNIYFQVFDVKKNVKLNIFDYLTLERYFKLSDKSIDSTTLCAYLGEGYKIVPFSKLSDWDCKSKPEIKHTPIWWKAYNSIKHSSENIIINATLDSAIYSISALYQIIHRVYGSGLICGYLYEPIDLYTDKLHPVRTSVLFQGEYLRATSKPNTPPNTG